MGDKPHTENTCAVTKQKLVPLDRKIFTANTNMHLHMQEAHGGLCKIITPLVVIGLSESKTYSLYWKHCIVYPVCYQCNITPVKRA